MITSGSALKKGAHCGSKVKSYLGLHLHLSKALLGNFDRVFCRPDLCVRLIYMMQGCMKGSGFTATGRPYDKDNSVRLATI